MRDLDFAQEVWLALDKRGWDLLYHCRDTQHIMISEHISYFHIFYIFFHRYLFCVHVQY